MLFSYDFNKKTGKIKPMHGIGQPPFIGVKNDMMHYVGEAGMPYSRLHDVGGPYGGNMYVDIHNVFRDFDKDENDPASYDFTFTDWLLNEIVKQGAEPIYRLGETIENFHYIKAYRIFPPKDPKKWARICEHIIKHYNYGWADGFHMNIKYWEIWNEPDNAKTNSENQMWHGTREEFFELYTVTAKHLKAVFGDEIKVGGYATCGFRHILSDPEKYGVNCEKSEDACYSSENSKNFIDFFEAFFDHIKREKAPIDFFSWHSYLTTENTLVAAEYLDRRLNEFGYGGLETQLNEWNNVCEDRGDPTVATEIAVLQRGTPMAAAKTVSMMCAMQNTKTKLLCYYDAQVGLSYYQGMFNPFTQRPEPLYHAFIAFNELYKLGNQVYSSENKDGVYTLAAEADGKRAVIITNTGSSGVNIETNLCEMNSYIVAEGKNLEITEIDTKSFTLDSGNFVLLKNYL